MSEMKSYPNFDAYLKDQPRANQAVIRALRALVKRAAPSLAEAVKYSNGCWLQGKYPIVYVYAAADHTQFGFMSGAKFADSASGLPDAAESRAHRVGCRDAALNYRGRTTTVVVGRAREKMKPSATSPPPTPVLAIERTWMPEA